MALPIIVILFDNMLPKVKRKREIKALRCMKIGFMVLYYLAMIMSGIIHEEFPPPPLRDSPDGTNYTSSTMEIDISPITDKQAVKNLNSNLLKSDITSTIAEDTKNLKNSQQTSTSSNSQTTSEKIEDRIEKLQHDPEELEAIQKNKADQQQVIRNQAP